MRVSEIQARSVRRLKKLLKKSQSEESKQALQKIIEEIENAEILIDFDVDELRRPRGSFPGYGGGGC